MAEKKQKVLTYKNRPLVRQGRSIYYGDMSADHVVMMQILSTKKVGELDVADKVNVQLVKTDPSLKPMEAIVKTSPCRGLGAALDRASTWLDVADKGEESLD
ncbi:MAG: hypothetical protein K6C36_06960 [Clostridia bacterium]|nr:hypothetical protein [Clostridia bacterium]